MAEKCTVDSLTQHDTAASLTSLTTFDTDTGCYIDVEDTPSRKLIILVKRDSTTKAGSIKIKASTVRGIYTGSELGDLSVSLTTGDAVARQQLLVIGPVESARFTDSDDRINITCTGSTTVLAVGVLKIA